FLSAQVTAWLADDGWRARAAHANDAATRLAAGLAGVPGVRLVRPVQTNHVFAALPAPIRASLDRAGYVLFAWPQFGEDVDRFVTNWTTPEEEIDELVRTMSTA
ncbi:MAG: low specificity L-threonine aldolase, partial [Thermomicrobiales bacterium]